MLSGFLDSSLANGLSHFRYHLVGLNHMFMRLSAFRMTFLLLHHKSEVGHSQIEP